MSGFYWITYVDLELGELWECVANGMSGERDIA